ncbi:protease inhibitor I9 family protein [Streptomyces sp. NBC_00435]|uniref:protease inhibitor I9 family protein n=1 Tax=Streptomyces sp. NBC_00435 TaxID=2903649 RepID=UPI002E1C724D
MRRPLPLPAPLPLLRPVLVAALLLAAPVALAPVAHADQGTGLSAPRAAEVGTYIVTLVPGADPAQVMRETGVTEVRYVYRSVVRGFAAELNEAQLTAVRAHPDVTGVERDGGVVGAPVQPWGWGG